MTAVTRVVVDSPGIPGCARATVLSAADDGALTLCLPAGDVVVARPVLGLPVAPQAGDAVLCAPALGAEGRTEHYVVAVIATLRPAEASLRVTHDAANRRSVVQLPPGSVRFEAEGDLEFSATKTVRVEGARIEAKAGDADVTVDRGTLRARRWETVAAVAVQTVDVLETRATRVVTRAKNLYQQVEELAQTQAGRLRLVADGAFHLHARRVLVKAEEDVKLRGEKIHLG
jgi:hypothetical protein